MDYGDQVSCHLCQFKQTKLLTFILSNIGSCCDALNTNVFPQSPEGMLLRLQRKQNISFLLFYEQDQALHIQDYLKSHHSGVSAVAEGGGTGLAA